MKVDYDTWNGNRNVGGSININPAEKQKLYDLLNRLDQKKFTQIVLGADSGFLIIGGGNGQYVCTITVGEHDEFYNLMNQAGGDEEVYLVTGGQSGVFPERLINTFSNTLEAMEYYLNYQQMIPSMKWENK